MRVQEGYRKGTGRVQEGFRKGTGRGQEGYRKGTGRVQEGFRKGSGRAQEGYRKGTGRVQEGHRKGTGRVQDSCLDKSAETCPELPLVGEQAKRKREETVARAALGVGGERLDCIPHLRKRTHQVRNPRVLLPTRRIGSRIGGLDPASVGSDPKLRCGKQRGVGRSDAAQLQSNSAQSQSNSAQLQSN